MMRVLRIAIGLGLISLGPAFFCLPAATRSNSLQDGMNIENPQRLARPEQDRILQQLEASGVRLIRVPLAGQVGEPGNIDQAIGFITRASRRGIRTSMIVMPRASKDVPMRPWNRAYPTLWGAPPMSRTTPDVTRAQVRNALARLDTAGVRLAGIEVGNEINATAFNGDFPVPGTGRVYDYDDLTKDPALASVARGFRAYVGLVRAVRAERDRTRLNRNAPIISAGLADPGPRRTAVGEKADAVTIPATLRYLREQGLDALVEAYGIHAYPGPGIFGGQALEERVFGACGTKRGGKPCWLTEWGFKSASLACRSSDADRSGKIREFRKLIHRLARERVLDASFYYQWRGDKDPFGVHRCGVLTAGGQSLLQR